HSDNATEASDTYLQGASSLEGLLASNGVDMVFNGHAHMYERNAPALGNMVSYVTGGGGGVLEPTGGYGCTAIDLYSIGWSPTGNVGSRCGSATAPTSPSQVYHFLHVTVSGSTVTVAPQNALGQTFDVATYNFPATPPPATTTLAPIADTFVYQGAPAASSGTTNPLLSSAGSYRSLLRFDTSGIDPAATVTGVTLRLYSTVGLSSGGVQVHPESDTWDEATTTWSNQPAWNASVLATSTTPTSPGWLSIPLPTTSITAGSRTSFGLNYSVASVIERIASREDAGNPPQLVVTVAPAPVTTTLASTADTFVYQGIPAQTNGSTTPLLASAGTYRGLLRFDTSWIGAGANVTGVTLRLYATVGLPSGGIQVRPENDAWSEAGTSWSNQPPWSSQVLTTSATQTVPGWISISIPPSAITRSANTNFGLSYSVAQMIERVSSRENATTSPQLLVTAS
ncbi:MAG: acid phosphatase type 7, partial [Actinomycetota bacterium]|nr:acid phosphatase type 7 [Actinomycetota bacterium]